MTRFLLAAGLLAAQGMAQVVINEFQYDDSGTDDVEFVELYNNSNSIVDISGWSIVNRDASSPLYGGIGTDPTQTVPLGTLLLPFSYYVLGNLAVANVNQVIPANSLENDNESIELYDAALNLQDSVCYEMGQGAFGVPPLAFPLEGNGLYGDLAVNNGPSTTIARKFDGADTNRNAVDFLCTMPPSPGASNSILPALPYVENSDFGTLLGTVPGMIGGFVGARYVDPTVVDSQNQWARPSSPQGGLAVSVWDNTGGGNSAAVITTPVSDVVLECFAYFEPVMTPVNTNIGPPYNVATVGTAVGTYNFADGEMWIAGVRGSIAANSNPADVPGTYFSDIALGVGFRPHQVTGIAWVHYRTITGSVAYLVDFHDGAQAPVSPNPPVQNFTILGGPINIVSGVNDGWQRIRITVQGDTVVGNFGGTYGCDNGTRFSGTTTTVDPGLVYFGYREAILLNANCHPPAFDAIDVHVPTANKSHFGFGTPLSNSNIPVVDSDGLALLGSTGFALKGSNMLPGSFAYMALGTGIFPGGVPIPGAPGGANIYMFPFDLEFFLFPDINGNAQVSLPVPCDLALDGIPFATQIANFDLGLSGPGISLPIAVTAPLLSTIGR